MKATLVFLSIAAAIAVYAAEEPSMKEGLWLIHSQLIQHPSEEKTTDVTVTICRNPAYDKQLREGSMPKGCKLVDKSGGGITKFEAECKYAGAKSKSTEIFEITGDTASHTVTDTTVTPPASGVTGLTAVADMKYVGACPAGMKIGDMMMPDGTFAQVPIPDK